jgi:hypothetical protein
MCSVELYSLYTAQITSKRQIVYLYTGLDRLRGLQEVEAPRQSAQEGCEFISPTHRPSLPPIEDPWYSFLLEAESTAGP